MENDGPCGCPQGEPGTPGEPGVPDYESALAQLRYEWDKNKAIESLLADAETERDMSESYCKTLQEENARLLRGDWTKEEAHGICHNLHGKVNINEFANGCRMEMIKLYGSCPFDALQARVKELEDGLREMVWAGKQGQQVCSEIADINTENRAGWAHKALEKSIAAAEKLLKQPTKENQ